MELISVSKLVAAVLLASIPAAAAEMAVLRNGYSIRHDSHEAVGGMTRLHTGSGYVDIPTDQIVGFEQDDSTPAPASTNNGAAPVAGPAAVKSSQIQELVTAASGRHLVDPDLVTSVIHAESGFNPQAVSPKGAQGLMQLMPQTASELGVQNAFEASANVDAGTRYLRELLLRYNGDVATALAAYNAGAHRVEQYRGVPPYRETHAYVARVIREFNSKKLAAKKTAKTSFSSKRAAPEKRKGTSRAELRTVSSAAALTSNASSH
ncbi:MAG: lytic transglycosylase domain-containing protein [Terriglobales bacterium]